MTRLVTLIAALLIATPLIFQRASAAEEEPGYIAYVSSSGLSTNDCASPATACGGVGTALSKLVDGGTVQCVDAGLYGIATITISVTIDCSAGGGGKNADFLSINAPGKKVVLRNIAINGSASSADGIFIQAADSVYIENVLINEARALHGINDQRAGPGTLVIRNSNIVKNRGVGILVVPSSGTIGVELDNVHSDYNSFGLAAATGGRVMIKNSTFVGNTNAGVEGDGGSQISVDGSTLSHNGFGVQSGSSVRISNNNIAFNATAISGATGTFANNRFSGNTSVGTAPTPLGGASSAFAQQ
jgi:hypothetical protein